MYSGKAGEQRSQKRLLQYGFAISFQFNSHWFWVWIARSAELVLPFLFFSWPNARIPQRIRREGLKLKSFTWSQFRLMLPMCLSEAGCVGMSLVRFVQFSRSNQTEITHFSNKINILKNYKAHLKIGPAMIPCSGRFSFRKSLHESNSKLTRHTRARSTNFWRVTYRILVIAHHHH